MRRFESVVALALRARPGRATEFSLSMRTQWATAETTAAGEWTRVVINGIIQSEFIVWDARRWRRIFWVSVLMSTNGSKRVIHPPADGGESERLRRARLTPTLLIHLNDVQRKVWRVNVCAAFLVLTPSARLASCLFCKIIKGS